MFYTVARCDAQPSAPCEASAKLAFSVDDQVEETVTPAQTGQSLIDLFGINPRRVLFRDYESPSDQPITPAGAARYSDGPVFYTHGTASHEVEITIDLKVHKVKPGEYTVTQLKGIGGVAPTLELEQVVRGVLTPLPDDAKVCITGCEVFVSHPRSGGSS